jgi:hypothetical protein
VSTNSNLLVLYDIWEQMIYITYIIIWLFFDNSKVRILKDLLICLYLPIVAWRCKALAPPSLRVMLRHCK